MAEQKPVDHLTGRELDAAVAEEMGWHDIEPPMHAAGGFGSDWRGKPPGKRRASDTEPIPKFSSDPALAVGVLWAVAGVKYRSYTVANGDGTGAEPRCWCDIRTGNHNVIAEGFGGVITWQDDPSEREEEQEHLHAFERAICRAVVKAVRYFREKPDHAMRSVGAWPKEADRDRH